MDRCPSLTSAPFASGAGVKTAIRRSSPSSPTVSLFFSDTPRVSSASVFLRPAAGDKSLRLWHGAWRLCAPKHMSPSLPSNVSELTRGHQTRVLVSLVGKMYLRATPVHLNTIVHLTGAEMIATGAGGVAICTCGHWHGKCLDLRALGSVISRCRLTCFVTPVGSTGTNADGLRLFRRLRVDCDSTIELTIGLSLQGPRAQHCSIPALAWLRGQFSAVTG